MLESTITPAPALLAQKLRGLALQSDPEVTTVLFWLPTPGKQNTKFVRISALTGDGRFFIVIRKFSLHAHTC